mgnify:FL=1
MLYAYYRTNIDTALMPIEPTKVIIYSDTQSIIIEVSSLSLNAPQAIHLYIYCYQKLCELVNVQTMYEVHFEAYYDHGHSSYNGVNTNVCT